MTRTRRGNAGKGEVLQEGAEFFVVGGVSGRWPSFAPNLADSGGASSFVPLVRDFGGHVGGRPRGGRGSVNDCNGGLSPGGGGGGQAEGKFNIVAVGNHIGAGRAGSKPSGALDE